MLRGVAIPMEVTYKNILGWFDTYFKDVNKNQGPLERVVNLKKYFTSDFEFIMYTAPPFFKPPLSRDGLFMLFVHPGLHETLRPQYYVVDVKRMIVVVQFELQFTDEPSGKAWPPKQASAYYHLTVDETGDLKITKIQYWTESSPPDVTAPMYALWKEYRAKALTDLGMDFIRTNT
jgi:hypothetical protein